MVPTAGSVLDDLLRVWQWFVPAWIHAFAVTCLVITAELDVLQLDVGEEVFFGVYFAGLFVGWGLAVLAVRRHEIAFSRAAVFVLAPYVPAVIWSILAS